jgi:hypothetical protein
VTRNVVGVFVRCVRRLAVQRSIYQCVSKGALIGMCIDIIIREKKVMAREDFRFNAKLSNEFGV